MQLLDDLHIETKRLFIAGSKFARDDPRISKYIPVLERMGEKAPIMKKLAEKYAVLVESGQPEALADAGTFLYAVMATTAVTELSGEPVEAPPSIFEMPKTHVPYSRLAPVLEALMLSKQGREAVIRTAFREGLLNDFRLYGALAAGLDDKYSAVADFIYTDVIPSIGAPIIPYILERYNPNGKRGDAMRLALLDMLGCADAERLAFNAIEEGDPVVAVEGIKILGANPANEEYLLKLAADKKAAFREAAFIGLVRMDSARGKELVMKTLEGAKYKSAIPAAALCADPEYTGKMLGLVKPHYDSLLEMEPGQKLTEANNKFLELFAILENKDEPAVYEFFDAILKSKDYVQWAKANKIDYHSGDVRPYVCKHLLKCPADKAVRVFEDGLTPETVKSTNMAVYYFRAALKAYTPERIFDVFSKYYILERISFDQMFQPVEALREYQDDYSRERVAAFEEIDPRWKKVFVQKKDMSAISALLSEGDELEQEMKGLILKQAKECSSKKTGGVPALEFGRAMGRLAETAKTTGSVLFKSEHEKAAEICYKIFENADVKWVAYFYTGLTKENFLKLFYPEYTEKFRELMKSRGHYVYHQITEAIHEAEKESGNSGE